jgi:hypothetical protein
MGTWSSVLCVADGGWAAEWGARASVARRNTRSEGAFIYHFENGRSQIWVLSAAAATSRPELRSGKHAGNGG